MPGLLSFGCATINPILRKWDRRFVCVSRAWGGVTQCGTLCAYGYTTMLASDDYGCAISGQQTSPTPVPDIATATRTTCTPPPVNGEPQYTCAGRCPDQYHPVSRYSTEACGNTVGELCEYHGPGVQFMQCGQVCPSGYNTTLAADNPNCVIPGVRSNSLYVKDTPDIYSALSTICTPP